MMFVVIYKNINVLNYLLIQVDPRNWCIENNFIVYLDKIIYLEKCD